jgi:hypothetical protein
MSRKKEPTLERIPARSLMRMKGYENPLSVVMETKSRYEAALLGEEAALLGEYLQARCSPCSQWMDRDDNDSLVLTFTCGECGGAVKVERLDVGAMGRVRGWG